MISQRLKKFMINETRRPSRSNNYSLPRVFKSAWQKDIEFCGVELWNEISKNLKNKPFNSLKKQFKENLLREYCLCC